jgi:alkanesulfonate monooxygenase SsuD/methylene tetrahydromethanopterin reductase-like flavin-dependent oxidoreductase (luciferase family)
VTRYRHGWLEEEFQALVPFEERAARTAEVRAIRSLWKDEAEPFHGRFYRWEKLESHPKPVRSPASRASWRMGSSRAPRCMPWQRLAAEEKRRSSGTRPAWRDLAQVTRRGTESHTVGSARG